MLQPRGNRMSEAWRDATHSPQQRARELLAQMTLDEKLAQLGCVWSTELIDESGFSAEKAREHLSQGTGHITRVGGSTGNGINPQSCRRRSTEVGVGTIVVGGFALVAWGFGFGPCGRGGRRVRPLLIGSWRRGAAA